MNNAIRAGNAMYWLGIQLKVAKALFTNFERYANISVHPESRDSQFKKKPNLKTMLTYLEMTCLTEERTKGKRSLLSQFSKLEDSDERLWAETKTQKEKGEEKPARQFWFLFWQLCALIKYTTQTAVRWVGSIPTMNCGF